MLLCGFDHIPFLQKSFGEDLDAKSEKRQKINTQWSSKLVIRLKDFTLITVLLLIPMLKTVLYFQRPLWMSRTECRPLD